MPTGTTSQLNQQKILQAQLHVQNNLDGDLSLEAVARRVGSSRFHFHRLFKEQLGETLSKYVERLRVEASVTDLYLSELNLLQIALRYGFKNPDTYTRAFRRRFATVPSAIERRRLSATEDIPGRAANGSGPGPKRPRFQIGLRCSRESNFSVTRLTRLHLAFRRHLGPYLDVPPIAAEGATLWRQLENFALENDLAQRPFIYIGIARDSPETTDESKLRYDACLLVQKPFRPRGEIGHLEIEHGYYGVLRHAGPYSTLGVAYEELFRQASKVPGYRIDPSSLFELLLDVDVKTNQETTWSELYLRLRRSTL